MFDQFFIWKATINGLMLVLLNTSRHCRSLTSNTVDSHSVFSLYFFLLFFEWFFRFRITEPKTCLCFHLIAVSRMNVWLVLEQSDVRMRRWNTRPVVWVWRACAFSVGMCVCVCVYVYGVSVCVCGNCIHYCCLPAFQTATRTSPSNNRMESRKPVATICAVVP